MDAFKIVSSGGRISFEQALELENCSLHELARAANARRWAFSEPGSVGYIVNRMINYSNVCMARCKFCAYHAKAGKVAPFKMSDDEIFDL